jgi:SRSO17 transposase
LRTANAAQRPACPAEIKLAIKTGIALAQLERPLAEAAPKHCVLADAGYGADTSLRGRLDELGLTTHMAGTALAIVVWPLGVEPLPHKHYAGQGRPPVVPRRTRQRQPQSVKALAAGRPANAFQPISRREGTNAALSGRFAAVRVRHELSCWSGDLEQELGPGHHEGCGRRGFHHHASRSIAAYGFLVCERLAAGRSSGSKRNLIARQRLPFPRMTFHAAALRAQRHVSDSVATLRHQLSVRLIQRLDRCPHCGSLRMHPAASLIDLATQRLALR